MTYQIMETCLLVPGIDRTACAAWVQAWGTIIAVAATGFAVKHAHKLAVDQREKERFDQYTQYLEVLFQIAGAMAQVLQKMRDLEAKTPGPSPADYDAWGAELDSLHHAIRQFDSGKLQSFEHIQSWSACLTAANHSKTAVAYVRNPQFNRSLEQGYLNGILRDDIALTRGAARSLLHDIESRKPQKR